MRNILFALILSALCLPARADMEPALIVAGPQDGEQCTNVQTQIELVWEGHALNPTIIPYFIIADVTESHQAQPVECYDVELTSHSKQRLDAALFDFSHAGVTRKLKEGSSTEYEPVYGDFEITIPRGIFESAAADPNPEQIIHFSQVNPDEPTSLSIITADDAGNIGVYTLSGIKVLSTPDPSRLKELPQGLYIINGKKVLVRR